MYMYNICEELGVQVPVVRVRFERRAGEDGEPRARRLRAATCAGTAASLSAAATGPAPPGRTGPDRFFDFLQKSDYFIFRAQIDPIGF